MIQEFSLAMLEVYKIGGVEAAEDEFARNDLLFLLLKIYIDGLYQTLDSISYLAPKILQAVLYCRQILYLWGGGKVS